MWLIWLNDWLINSSLLSRQRQCDTCRIVEPGPAEFHRREFGHFVDDDDGAVQHDGLSWTPRRARPKRARPLLTNAVLYIYYKDLDKHLIIFTLKNAPTIVSFEMKYKNIDDALQFRPRLVSISCCAHNRVIPFNQLICIVMPANSRIQLPI